jgi:hypothetical protein
MNDKGKGLWGAAVLLFAVVFAVDAYRHAQETNPVTSP